MKDASLGRTEVVGWATPRDDILKDVASRANGGCRILFLCLYVGHDPQTAFAHSTKLKSLLISNTVAEEATWRPFRRVHAWFFLYISIRRDSSALR